MAKIPTANKKRLLALAGVALAVVFILYFGIIRAPGSEPRGIESERSRPVIPDIPRSLLEGATLGEFSVWKSLPIEVGATGKENIFSK